MHKSGASFILQSFNGILLIGCSLCIGKLQIDGALFRLKIKMLLPIFNINSFFAFNLNCPTVSLDVPRPYTCSIIDAVTRCKQSFIVWLCVFFLSFLLLTINSYFSSRRAAAATSIRPSVQLQAHRRWFRLVLYVFHCSIVSYSEAHMHSGETVLQFYARGRAG